MSQEPQLEQDTGEELNDFLDSIGLDVKPLSPEHALLNKLAGGQGYKKIHNYRYWLRHEMHSYFDMLERGISFSKDTIDPVTKAIVTKPLTQAEYVHARTKYYLEMHYLPWFNSDQSGIGVANLDEAAKMVAGHEDVRGVATAQKKDDIPRNI